MSYVNEFDRLIGRRRLSEWKLEAADNAKTTFDALLSKHLAADVKMNNRDGYAPTAGVLAQREYSRQYDELEQLGKSVRSDYWQEWSGKNKVQVGFRDNRDKAQYQTAVERLRDVLQSSGYTLFPRGTKMLSPKSSGANHVVLKSNLADQMKSMHKDWLKAMANAGAAEVTTEGKLSGARADEAFAAAFAGRRTAEGVPMSFDDWNATMKLALERNLGEEEWPASPTDADYTYNKFNLAKVSAVLAPFSNLTFTPGREFGPVLSIGGDPATLATIAKVAEKKLGAFEAKMVSKTRLRIVWD